MDKFKTALSRMNITLELDVPQLHPAGTDDEFPDSYSMSDDVSISHGVPGHPASGEESDGDYPGTDNGRDYYSNGGETSDYTIPRDDLGSQLDENDSYTIPRSEHDVHFDDPVGKVDNARDFDAAQSRIEQNLEHSAIAFHERYHTKFTVLTALRQWQMYSESLNLRWSQYREALESDMVGVVEDTFRAWRMLSAEAEEVLPPDLPSNIYSKRTEQIAARTYQIFATKNAFSRWRRRAKERCRRREQQEVRDEPLDPLERVAVKAHETLMLSRAFVRWSNRSTQEAKKARMAAKIYEMSLKSKAFGPRRRPDESLFDQTPPDEDLEPEIPSQEAPALTEEDELFYGDSRSAEMQQKAEMARKLFLMRSLAKRTSEAQKPDREEVGAVAANEEATSDGKEYDHLHETQQSVQLTQQLFSIKALAIRRKESSRERDASKPEKGRVVPTEPAAKNSASGIFTEKSDDKIEDELDEKTLLARRHILRMRFFNAWESYTLSHVTKVKEFAVQKTIEPWRERVTELHDTECRYTRGRQNRVLRGTVSAWVHSSRQSEDLEEKTGRAGQRLRVEHVLKPWIAASREKQKLSEKKSWAFNVWFDHEDDEALLEIMADQQCFSQRAGGALRHWKVARDAKSARRTVFKTYSDRAVYYYNVTSALRAWKAAARETAIQKSMKTEALEIWQKAWQDELPRQEEMRSWAADIHFTSSAAKALPIWRAAAQQTAEIQEQRQNYAEKADYYYKTKGTLSAWRVLAQARHKKNIKKAHSEARRMIKKGMGERCIARWRAQLQPSFDRFEALNGTLDEIVIQREWGQVERAFDAWRDRAVEQAGLRSASDMRHKQKTLDHWRDAAAERGQLGGDAAAYWREKAQARALRGWSLAALQRTGRKHTVANLCEKRERRLLRGGFDAWFGRAEEVKILRAGNDVTARGDDGGDDYSDGGGSGDFYGADHDHNQVVVGIARQETAAQSQNQARGLLHTWQAAAASTGARGRGGGGGGGGGQEVFSSPSKGKANARVNNVSVPVPMSVPEDEVYIPTPGRPRLPLLGSLAASHAVSTTPLAPVPSRASWHPGGAGRGSVLGSMSGSVVRAPALAPTPAPDSRFAASASARASRSKRNLRVSWAD